MTEDGRRTGDDRVATTDAGPDPFGAAGEALLCERVMGERRHGL